MPKRKQINQNESNANKMKRIDSSRSQSSLGCYSTRSNNQNSGIFNVKTGLHIGNVIPTSSENEDKNDNFFVKKEKFINYQEKNEDKLNRIFEFIQQFNANHIQTKGMIDQMLTKINCLERKIEILKETSIELVPFYPNSKLMVNRIQLQRSLKPSKINAFIDKIMTSLFSVEDLYLRNLKGHKSFVGQLQKKPFNPEYIEEIHNAVVYYFPNEDEDELIKKADKSISKKLNDLNKHFQGLINNKEIEGRLDENETKNFRNYEIYFNDLTLFEALERQLYGDSDLLEQKNLKIEIKPLNLSLTSDNQLIANIEQSNEPQNEVTNSHLDLTNSYIDQISSFIDQANSYADQVTCNAHQATCNAHQATCNAHQTNSNADQANSYVDQTISSANQTISSANQANSFVDQTNSYADQISFYADQSNSFVNPTNSFVDQSNSHLAVTNSSANQTSSYANQVNTLQSCQNNGLENGQNFNANLQLSNPIVITWEQFLSMQSQFQFVNSSN